MTRRTVAIPLLGAVLAALGLVGITASPAAADCDGELACPDSGDVVLNPETPGETGDPGNGGGDVGVGTGAGTTDTSSSGGGGPSTCTYQGKTIPCTSQNGTWSSADNCYLKLSEGLQVAPPGATNPDGAWYNCSRPSQGDAISVTTTWVDDPQEVLNLPSPAELAQEAVETMNLQAIEIGIVPEDAPGKQGLVGLPTWMWVANPTGNTFGPITESATAGPLTVTATGKVSAIDWNMGDGSVVSCGEGTVYRDAFEDQDSPTCGHRYTQTSADQPGQAYTITASSHWVVNWSGGGQSGTIEVDHTNDTQIRIGELQVLSQQ